MIKIYFIKCLETGETYIGSTKKKYIASRIAEHRVMNRITCSCKDIILRDNYKYGLLEEVKDEDRFTRERYWIQNTDKCVNILTPYGYNRSEYKKHYNSVRNYRKTWGGDYRSNNNLLEISMDLFN